MGGMDYWVQSEQRQREAAIKLLLYQHRRLLESMPPEDIERNLRWVRLQEAHLTQDLHLFDAPASEDNIEKLLEVREACLSGLSLHELVELLDLSGPA
jgi:hypothetical protein